MEGPGCLVGLSGTAQVRSDAGVVELRKASAVVVPAGAQVTVEADGGAVSFARCMAPR